MRALFFLGLVTLIQNVGSTARLSEQSNFGASRIEDDTCSDRLCYGLPMGCQGSTAPDSPRSNQLDGERDDQSWSGSSCSVLVTSKRVIDPSRPVARDIFFELIALPVAKQSSYAAVGFSENGRMQGLVTECVQYRDPRSQLLVVKLKHSYNNPSDYRNIPVSIISGLKELETSYVNGRYQCRWLVESAVEFSYEANNGSLISRREDLGYKNYHILLATGDYDEVAEGKCFRGE